jgi:glc operon protein GlcG
MTIQAVRTRRLLDTQGAREIARAAEEQALAHDRHVVIAVVDPWGHVLELRRTEGTQIASDQVAIDKARTAAIFVRSSRELEEQVSGGRLGALALHGAAALTGGIPIRIGEEVVGAIGTSGETPDEDEDVSLAGANAVASTTAVHALTAEGARLGVQAAAGEALGRGVAPVVAAVDAGGELIHLWRPDEAQVASIAVATDKARTAALFRRPSRDFEEQTANGRPSALHLAGAVPLQGGIPVLHEGQVIGALGVSGASSAEEDNELAVIGAEAIGATQALDTDTARLTSTCGSPPAVCC